VYNLLKNSVVVNDNMNYNYLIKNKTVDRAAAFAAGFTLEPDNALTLKRDLPNGLVVTVRLTETTLDVDVFDGIFNEKYAPFYGGHGGAAIKSEVRDMVDAALSQCTQSVNLKTQIMQWLTSTYGTVPETPWEDSPSYYTFKTAKTGKWYALFMDIAPKFLSLPGDALIQVVNVKADADDVQNAVDNEHVFPAYHMNKQHWLTILLNATTDVAQLKNLLAKSYLLADGKSKK